MTNRTAVDEFLQISQEPRFQGWPVVGEITLGEKIPFFGQPIHYQLETGNGIEDYTSLLRHFGWAVVFGVTAEGLVPTLCQWKPGVNQASWELPPGGIGKVSPNITEEELLEVTQRAYLKETGLGNGNWHYLGALDVESGKYRGAGPNDHGLPAHMFLATELAQVASARNPEPNEIMETIFVPLVQWDEVLDSGLFREISAVPCALLALRKLAKIRS